MFNFMNNERTTYLDLSSELRDEQDWKAGVLRTLDYHLDVTAFAVDPVNGFAAVATSTGTIRILGSPGVETKVKLPEGLRIKFLQFAISVFKLVCVDEQDRLHVWDLATYGAPKLQRITRFSPPVTSLTLSPSHTHAFLTLEAGEIRTYDLLCLSKSPYSINNLWAVYEKKMVASGITTNTSYGSRIPVEVVVHPRDLNLIFVAYGGGIVMCDLRKTQRNTLRAYEYVAPAGAPGANGYHSHDLLTHRRPLVTSIAVHPAGHFFSAGYADGTIAFWAVEDEDQPILARTLDDLDVNVVDGPSLEKYLPDETKSNDVRTPAEREPIFKLAWSGFPNSSDARGGETALTILGGQTPDQPPGVTVHWLPAFNPPEPPTPLSNPNVLHPYMRSVMRESVHSIKSYSYATAGVPQDFFLTPRDNPHYSMAFDPTAIIFLTEAEGDTRALEAYQFPPPDFVEPISPVLETKVGSSDLDVQSDFDQDIASTLKSMKIDAHPRQLRLHTALWSGNSAVVHGDVIKVERDSYQTLTEEEDTDDRLLLHGGIAWTDESRMNEAKLSKYQPHRILITHHRDLSVRFQDVSAQILISSNTSPIQKDFPNPIPRLTIDVAYLLADPFVSAHSSAALIRNARISAVRLASDSLECVVVFATGELIVYRLDTKREDAVYRDLPDEELTVLEHLPRIDDERFHPYFMLSSDRGPVTACEISDIGFLAVAYADASLIIIDMRTPKVVLRYDQDPRAKHRHSITLHQRHTAGDYVSSLTWTVCGLSTDSRLQIRLVSIMESGMSKVFTMSRPSGSSAWAVEADPVEVDAIPRPIPRGSFIIDGNTGAPWKADRTRLAAALQPSASSNDEHGLWVVCGAKGVKCVADINGGRIGRADWSSKAGSVRSAQIVERNGSFALVAFTNKQEALIYSLPNLEFLHVLHLPSDSDELLSADETGDFIQWIRQPQTNIMKEGRLSSLFDIRRAYGMPAVDLTSGRRTVPSQPQPVSAGPASILSSWFRFGQSMSGEQLDALLAGPDRPIPEERKPRSVPYPGPTNTGGSASGESYISSTLKGVQETQSNLYGRLTSALNERGQMLGDLEDRFSSLEEGSKGMVAQAKKLAAEQTAKSWFKFG